MFVFFFLLPPVFLVAWLVLFFRKQRKGLGLALLSFLAAVAAGLWAVFQSRSSTAGIGVLFLPLWGSLCGLLGWLFGRFKDDAARSLRLGAWACLCGDVFLAALLVQGGFREREKNARRDLQQAEYSRRSEANRKTIRELLARNPGRETAALEAEIKSHAGDRAFLIPALETDFVSEATLDRLSRNPDLGVVLTVARNRKTPPGTLERIYRESAYPDYYLQALAANENTPPSILRRLFLKPGAVAGLGQWLAGNPSTPRDVLKELAGSKEAWTLRSLLENKALDCDLLRTAKAAALRPGLSDPYKTAEYVRGEIGSLEPKLCPAP